MKNAVFFILFMAMLMGSCSQGAKTGDQAGASASESATVDPSIGQANVQDDISQQDIVKVAVGSPDHTTLVAALKAANLVNSLANAGPFTVFAPNNAAFEKLPPGTVEDLLKPENNSKLAQILQHHVTVSVFESTAMKEGQKFGMADGGSATVSIKDGAVYVGGAKILGSVRASNGIVHVVDAILQ